MTVLSEEQYLASKGVSYPTSGYCLDKLRGNRQIATVRGRKRFEKECENAEADYQARRNQAKAEYKAMVEAGEIREETSLEKHFRIAHGHPDNQSTQAARIILAKKGYDWETGQRIKEEML